MADLSQLTIGAADDGVWMDVMHPTTNVAFEPPMRIQLRGMDSDQYKKHNHSVQNRRISNAMKGMRGGGASVTFTSEESDVEDIQGLAACVVAWENVEWEGEQPQCNEQNAALIFTHVPWLREQVKVFVEDRSNFLKV